MSEFGGLWKHEKTQHALYLRFFTLMLGSMTLMQLAFLEESDRNFPWEKLMGTTKCTKCKECSGRKGAKLGCFLAVAWQEPL